MPQLMIAVDPGFDSLKVIANGKYFKIPFSTVETDERDMSDYGNLQDFILYKDEKGTTWRVGQYARGIIYDNKSAPLLASHLQELYSEERFISAEMSVGIRSVIAKAILENSLYNDQANLDIYLIVALPHAVRNKYAASIIGLLAGEHTFYMTFDNKRERRYHFSIKESHIFTVSQTVAAILGETSDDYGYIDEQKYYLLSNGPTLVIDGGYYTVGLVPIARGGIVDDKRAESDTMHAMRNVNIAVSNEISKFRSDIEHYSIEYLLSQGESTLRHIQDGKVVTTDLSELRKEKLSEECDNFIRYINGKYNDLLDFKYVLITGGTGAQYYNQMLDYYKGIGLMDERSFLLTKPTLDGGHLPVEYSIVAGAYKGLRGKIS